MYGYILPNIDSLDVKDYMLYKSVFCGICKSIGQRLGTVARLSTGYDMTFLALIVANIDNIELEFENSRCIGSLRKHLISKTSSFVEKIADTSVILAYYKIQDDIEDKVGIKAKVAKVAFYKAYLKAKTSSPNIDKVISCSLDKLSCLEKSNTQGIDLVSDCFGGLVTDIVRILCSKMNDNIAKMCYNIGKYIYLIDALDDIDSDYKNSEFNPFLVGKQIDNKSKFDRLEFFDKNRIEIEFCLASTINRIIECFNNTDFVGCYDLLKNIIHSGLRKKYNQVVTSRKKLLRYQASKDLKYPKEKIRDYNKNLDKSSMAT